MDEGFLILRQHSHAARGGRHQLQLFRGVDATFLGERGVEGTEHERGRAIHEAHDGAREVDEDVHGAGDGDGHLIGAAQGQSFRNKLAEQDMEIGNEGEGEGHGGKVRVEVRVGQAAHGLFKDAGDGGLADPAEGEAAESDAELDGGKEVAEIFLEAADSARAGPVFGDELLDARLAHAHQSKLRRHKKTVRQNEHYDGDAVKEEELRHFVVSLQEWRGDEPVPTSLARCQAWRR